MAAKSSNFPCSNADWRCGCWAANRIERSVPGEREREEEEGTGFRMVEIVGSAVGVGVVVIVCLLFCCLISFFVNRTSRVIRGNAIEAPVFATDMSAARLRPDGKGERDEDAALDDEVR